VASPIKSAGILLYRRLGTEPEVLLAHPGGPYWVKKDLGAWSIPKGEIHDGEEPARAALREFAEETGLILPAAPEGLAPLGSVKYKNGKQVWAWAVEGDFDPETLVSVTYRIEWPPRSERHIDVPEIDRAEWYTLEKAREKILPAQLPFLERAEELLGK
jgi:predicted NUDIX family NTP pyrophosphohydrolase